MKMCNDLVQEYYSLTRGGLIIRTIAETNSDTAFHSSSLGEWRRFAVYVLIISLYAVLLIPGAYAGDIITINPVESQEAFKNPLKGFRGGEYGTLSKDYIRWRDLESKESDGVEKIRKFCDKRWKDYPAGNRKVIPRVYLQYGSRNSWPDDMKAEDYSSRQFQDRLVRFVSRLGEAWDNDPRVAYVEMGIFGNWGEQESPAPSLEIQKLTGDAFTAAFKNKLVMIRRPWDMFTDYSFGCYWDSWAHWKQRNHYAGVASTAPRWKIVPVGGECAYNWGDLSVQPGKSPDKTLSLPEHRDYLLNSIRELHCNHLGWVADYSPSVRRVKEGAIIIQKAFGHRFVIKQVTYPKRLTREQPFEVYFSVVNTGSSPFYYNWPVEVSLLDKTTKQPVYKQLFKDIDVRQWLPGDDWDSVGQVYKTPAAVNEVKGTFSLPADLPAGQYILALAMLDPAGMRPSNRFAIVNYFTGGRHPTGYIGVEQDVSGPYTIDPASFNSLVEDNTLKYDFTPKHP